MPLSHTAAAAVEETRRQCEEPQTSRAVRPRVLTTHVKGNHPSWHTRVEMLDGWDEEYRRRRNKPELQSVWNDLRWSWKLFRASRGYDVVVTGSERMALIFALLQRFLRHDRVPHIFIECLWRLPEGRLRRWRRRTLLRWVAQAASRIVVHARRQVGAYESALGMAPGKFVFLRCQSSLYGAAYPVRVADYVFAGGDSGRDYSTLIEAARGLSCRVVIAALGRDHFRGLVIPSNVEIVTLDPEEFNRTMAGAKLVVVPLKGGLLHSGGHQGFENAMTAGKTVVVADEWAEDYIENGMTGILVPPGDPTALRVAIQALLDNPEGARAMGQRAKAASPAFDPEVFFRGVFRLAEEVGSADLRR